MNKHIVKGKIVSNFVKYNKKLDRWSVLELEMDEINHTIENLLELYKKVSTKSEYKKMKQFLNYDIQNL